MTAQVAEKDSKTGETRQRSTVAFPYMDLNAALALAKAIHQNAGSGTCDDGQLAAWSNQSSKSSGYRIQIATAKLFGVIESISGKYRLTPLGLMASDPTQLDEAKVHAFLNVPLYKAVFEKYNGLTLPPAAGLENDMVSIGVAEKVKDRARQAFERSAEAAGFFKHGKNRLVKPAITEKDSGSDKHQDDDSSDEQEALPPVVNKLDPVIKALVEKIPQNKEWTGQERSQWLQMMAMALDMAYGKDGSVDIKFTPNPNPSNDA
jgi:hypothetical protein